MGEHDWNPIVSGKSMISLSVGPLFEMLLMIKLIGSRFGCALLDSFTGVSGTRRPVVVTVICPALDSIIILS